MYLKDYKIFNESILYFSRNNSDISNCWNIIKGTSEVIELKCYLKPLTAKTADKELEYIRYENMFKGFVTNDINYREKIAPLTLGIGNINGENLRVQLLPTNNSPNSNILNDIVGTRIRLKVVEPLLMIDL